MGIDYDVTQPGFTVPYTGIEVPTSIDWFAFGNIGVYTGSDAIGFAGGPNNPLFEGLPAEPGVTPVPAPGTLAPLGIGLLGIAATRHRRKF